MLPLIPPVSFYDLPKSLRNPIFSMTCILIHTIPYTNKHPRAYPHLYFSLVWPPTCITISLALLELHNALLTTVLSVGKWCQKTLLAYGFFFNSEGSRGKLCINAVKRSTQQLQPQQEQQQRVWQVCFSWILGLSIEDRNVSFGGKTCYSPHLQRGGPGRKMPIRR